MLGGDERTQAIQSTLAGVLRPMSAQKPPANKLSAKTRAACLALCLFGAPAHAQSLETAAAAAHANGLSGVTLASRAGGIVTEIALGQSNRRTQRAHQTSDIWPWASVTKQIAAVLIMQEVERGRLSLDEPLTHALPAFRGPSAAQITIRRLLQHTSGLPNPETSERDQAYGVPSFYLRRNAPNAQRADALGFCATEPAAAPGARFDYNNCDYIVLGAILERVTGQSFAALVEARIARPLGLTSVFVAPRRRDHHRDVVGYDGEEEAPPINERTFGAGGALFGAARDLLRFDQALMDGRLLSPASRETLWSGDPALGYAALGAWSFTAPLAGCEGDVALIERRGAIGGVQVRNLIAPNTGRALVIFTNNGDFEFGEIWRQEGPAYALASAAFCAL